MKTVNNASPQKPQVNAPPPPWLEVSCNSSIHEARAILWLMATLDTGGEVPKNDERSDVESVGARFIAPAGWGGANALNSPPVSHLGHTACFLLRRMVREKEAPLKGGRSLEEIDLSHRDDESDPFLLERWFCPTNKPEKRFRC